MGLCTVVLKSKYPKVEWLTAFSHSVNAVCLRLRTKTLDTLKLLMMRLDRRVQSSVDYLVVRCMFRCPRRVRDASCLKCHPKGDSAAVYGFRCKPDRLSAAAGISHALTATLLALKPLRCEVSLAASIVESINAS